MGDDQWQVTVQVPMRLPASVRESLLDRVAATVSEWEPDDRDGWDADVSSQPAAEDSMWKRIYHERRWLHAEAVSERDRAEASRRDWAAEAAILHRLLSELVDDDPCWFDHHGGCQAHGFLHLKAGELCPHEEAKRALRAGLPFHAETRCACISDDQATKLGPGFSRPVCAVHPEVSP